MRFPAPYAALSSQSRGRKFAASPDQSRTEYQRDRDRIIHSTAFRRLQHKTQVFTNLGDESDHYRTRLTHTIEVAQISRTIARSLGINEDLAEAVALAHDLGHTPFGHAGEEVLNDLMKNHGGFNHNQQSLRVVDFLERRYPNHFGLNLTYELREAVIKHETETHLEVPEELTPSERPLLEGQIVNLADEIAYNGHDLDDGLSSELISFDRLRSLDFLKEMLSNSEKDVGGNDSSLLRFALIRRLVNSMVVDLVEEIRRRLKEYSISCINDVRQATERLVIFSVTQQEFNGQLKAFLKQSLYRHPDLNAAKKRSNEIITFLFQSYLDDPKRLPRDFRLRYPDQKTPRLVADYIAGMTDRFALGEYDRLH